MPLRYYSAPRIRLSTGQKRRGCRVVFVISTFRAGNSACCNRSWSRAARGISAVTPARRWRAPDTGPVVYDNLSRGHREAVRWGPLVEGDIADRAALAAALAEHRASAVMHFAAFAYVGELVADPATLLSQQSSSARSSLLDAMRDAGVGPNRLLLDLRDLWHARPACRSARRRRSSRSIPMARPSWRSSGRSIGTARPMACARCRCAISTLPAPTPTAKSARCTTRKRISFPLVLQTALGSGRTSTSTEPIIQPRTGRAIRDYIHVQDLADAHLRAFEYLARRRRQRGAEPRDRPRSFGARGDSRRRGASPGRPGSAAARRRAGPGTRRRWSPIPASQRELLGWRARISDLETIVRTALAWHTSNGAGRSAG